MFSVCDIWCEERLGVDGFCCLWVKIMGVASYQVVGVTGFPCVGKSCVSEILSGFGYRVIDVDKLAHKLLDHPDIFPLIVGRFGDRVVCDGAVLRSVLNLIVFNDDAALDSLEAITHDLLALQLFDEVSRAVAPVVIDAPLLYQYGFDKYGFDKYCDYVIRVVSDYEVRLRRALDRGWSSKLLGKLDDRQKSRPYFGPGDLLLVNDGNEEELEFKVRMIMGLVEGGYV